MKAALQWLMRRIGGYELYRVIRRGNNAPVLPIPEGWSIRPVDFDARRRLATEDQLKPRELSHAGLAAGAVFLALWNGGALLGVILYEPVELSWMMAFWPRLRGHHAVIDIWTIEACRRQGAGSVLLSQSATRFDRDPLAWTWWTNWPALATFRRCGWEGAGWMGSLRGHRFAWPGRTRRKPDAISIA